MKNTTIAIVTLIIFLTTGVLFYLNDNTKSDQPTDANFRAEMASLINRGESTNALSALSSRAEKEPQDADTQFLLGRAYYETGAYEQALSAFDAAIGLNDSLAEAYAYRARTNLFGYNNIKAARQDNKLALSITPELGIAHVNEADLALMTNNILRATYEYDKAIQLEPDLAEAFLRRGLFSFSNGYYQHAAQDFSQVLELRPADPLAWQVVLTPGCNYRTTKCWYLICRLPSNLLILIR